MSSGKQNPTRRQHDRVTASDVARLAGVSPMTVSRVVNGEARVRQSTRTAVLRAIEELGYSPNKAARSLASANPIRIALLYANPSSTYLSAMLMGVLEQARQSDTQVFVVECSVGSDAAGIIDYMIGRGVEGILLAPPLSDALDILKKLRKEDIPAVTIGAEHGQDGVSSVNIDDYRAAHAITRHVISLGHRRIGFIIGNSEQSASRLPRLRPALRLLRNWSCRANSPTGRASNPGTGC
jgi:LacI family transcriptional regulator